jgi:acetyltransferase-like isoleucine patch superfamily enzyme
LTVTQSRTRSLVESIANTAIGFVVSLGLTALLFPGLTIGEGAWITTIFTVASIARGYVVRRVFEGMR